MVSQLFSDASPDFTTLKELDRERFLIGYARYAYWRRTFNAPVEKANGATGDPEERVFTSAGTNFTGHQPGTRLRILDGDDKGYYTISQVAPGGDVTKVVVEEDWPVGNEADVSFEISMTDIYGDALPATGYRYTKRSKAVPIMLRLDPPRKELTKFGWDEPAEGIFEMSVGVYEDASSDWDFKPETGDIIQGPDGVAYEWLTVKPFDYFNAGKRLFLHWVGTAQRSYKFVPPTFPAESVEHESAQSNDDQASYERNFAAFLVALGQTQFTVPTTIREDFDGNPVVTVIYQTMQAEEGVDFTVSVATITWIGAALAAGEFLYVTYEAALEDEEFEPDMEIEEFTVGAGQVEFLLTKTPRLDDTSDPLVDVIYHGATMTLGEDYTLVQRTVTWTSAIPLDQGETLVVKYTPALE